MMNLIKITLATFVCTVVVSLLHAQDTVSLGECLKIALESNYSLQIVKNENEIATNNYTKGNAGLLPVVDASAKYSGSIANSVTTDFSDNTAKINGQLSNAASAGVNASWDIFSGYKAQTRYAQLRELKEISDLNTRFEIENLIAGVTAEYYYLIQQKRHKDNLEFILSISKERVRIAGINRALGSRSKLELLQAQVDFNSDSSALVRQQQQILASEIRLKTLMGELKQTYIVSDSSINLLPELVYSSLLERTLYENTQLQIAAKQINLSEHDLKIMRANSYPYLRLTSGYNYNFNLYNKGATKRSNGNGLDYGLTAGFPIFDGGNRRREIKNAQIALKNKELAQREAQLEVAAKLQEIYSSYSNYLGLIRMERQNLKTAHENYETAAIRYRLGELAGIDMREAQNSLQDAEKRLLDVEYNAKIDEISLMMLSGNIMEYFNEVS
ncbi:MAG: TolC family protein [Prevotellaceae bacterium]|jgi:outer membrane protein TolC|nr:TolC family protein [Prevotellaceae bacterium]